MHDMNTKMFCLIFAIKLKYMKERERERIEKETVYPVSGLSESIFP